MFDLWEFAAALGDFELMEKDLNQVGRASSYTLVQRVSHRRTMSHKEKKDIVVSLRFEESLCSFGLLKYGVMSNGACKYYL